MVGSIRLGLFGVARVAARLSNHGTTYRNNFERRMTVAIYSCPKCGMSVGTMTCGTCNKELVHDTLQLDGGKSVDIAKCPDGHGKIKSPQCCGEDMSCSV